MPGDEAEASPSDEHVTIGVGSDTVTVPSNDEWQTDRLAVVEIDTIPDCDHHVWSHLAIAPEADTERGWKIENTSSNVEPEVLVETDETFVGWGFLPTVLPDRLDPYICDYEDALEIWGVEDG